mmetsp:Transcript_45794/g.106374  ORF Transcript_45794/g.106374 Transcript_45794/m.106374 type:complete len:267 (+) Transcript_45794:39-839(+)
MAAAKRPREEGEPLEFFSAWFCPYAQRAWIALEHHGLKYQKVEGLLPDAPGPDFVAYKKHPRLLELNPKGLVPTLCQGSNAPAVYESNVCVEFADELATSKSNGAAAASLLPGTPSERAALRLEADWVNKSLCSPFYVVLVSKSLDDQKAAFDKMVASIDELETRTKLPFLTGDTLTTVDVTLIPWAHRIFTCKILETYKGSDFAINLTKRPKLAEWLDRVLALSSVQATLAETSSLVQVYKRYADGTAKSKVADAVRQGKTADTV